jgi:hypothetical protein
MNRCVSEKDPCRFSVRVDHDAVAEASEQEDKRRVCEMVKDHRYEDEVDRIGKQRKSFPSSTNIGDPGVTSVRPGLAEHLPGWINTEKARVECGCQPLGKTPGPTSDIQYFVNPLRVKVRSDDLHPLFEDRRTVIASTVALIRNLREVVIHEFDYVSPAWRSS